MADKITKFFKKLSVKERDRMLAATKSIRGGDTQGLDIKKIKGHDDLYRIRIGRIRIIYFDNGDNFEIKHAGFRDDQTYRDF
jgi:mRNA interferase RelE/StbE